MKRISWDRKEWFIAIELSCKYRNIKTCNHPKGNACFQEICPVVGKIISVIVKANDEIVSIQKVNKSKLPG